MSVFCFILTSCEAFLELFPQTIRYNCEWRFHNIASFWNVYLELPCNSVDCENRFYNNYMENILNRYSLLSTMTNVSQYAINNTFEFKWTATIVSSKTCSDETSQYQTILLDQDTYTQRFTFNDDRLEGSPYVPDSNNIYPNEHMYKMELQIFNVENEYDHTEGTLIWDYVWEKPSILGSDEWQFFFPNGGIQARYVPNRNYMPIRHIYIHDQYEDM